MSNLANVFEYGAQRVRSVIVDHNPWFVVKDVCDVLGLTNPTVALASIEEDEKKIVAVISGARGNPNMLVVNEPGLYRLIMRSNKPQARDFQRWVYHDMLPQVRATGIYIPENISLKQILEIALSRENARLAAEQQNEVLQERVLELAASVDTMTEELEQLRAENEAYTVVSDNSSTWHSIAAAAQRLGFAAPKGSGLPYKTMGQDNLFKFLQEAGVLIDSYTLHQRQVSAGRFRVKVGRFTPKGYTDSRPYKKVEVSDSGINYIFKLLIKAGYRPVAKATAAADAA